MRDKVNEPIKAIPHFENAIKNCEDLAAKLPDVHEWKLIELYIESVKAYGWIGELDKSKELLFDKSHEVLLKLLAADHRSNYGMWKKWLDVVELCFMNLQGQFKDGKISIDIWRDWLETTWDILRISCIAWNNELKKDVNILLPVVCRYVNEDGREEFVTKHFQEQYETILCHMVIMLASMYDAYQEKQAAIEFLAATLRAYKLFSHRVISEVGVLRDSIYFREIWKVEYNKFAELLSKIDGNDFNNAVAEFRQLESKIVFKNGNPVETDDMKWENIIKIYHEMLSLADKDAVFSHVHNKDIADCYGHLGYALFMVGEFSEAEKYLILKIDTLKNIEPYDLANHLCLIRMINCSQVSLGNFYANRDEYVKAIETFVEVLNLQIEFVDKHGLNIIDRTKTKARFIGSMIPLLDVVVVHESLQKISYCLEDFFNSGEGDSVETTFAKNWETIKKMGWLMPTSFSMIPFMFYEFIFCTDKSDIDFVKTKCTELIELIDKYEAAVIRRKGEDNPNNIDELFPLDTNKRTMDFYAYIKIFLTDKVPLLMTNAQN